MRLYLYMYRNMCIFIHSTSKTARKSCYQRKHWALLTSYNMYSLLLSRRKRTLARDRMTSKWIYFVFGDGRVWYWNMNGLYAGDGTNIVITLIRTILKCLKIFGNVTKWLHNIEDMRIHMDNEHEPHNRLLLAFFVTSLIRNNENLSQANLNANQVVSCICRVAECTSISVYCVLSLSNFIFRFLMNHNSTAFKVDVWMWRLYAATTDNSLLPA